MFSPIGTASRRAGTASSTATTTSPYQSVRSPSAKRRAKDAASNVGGSSTAGAAQQGESGDDDDSEHNLVSLNTLLETITRAVARRVFELHRGSKNKRMMASKQHELSKKK